MNIGTKIVIAVLAGMCFGASFNALIMAIKLSNVDSIMLFSVSAFAFLVSTFLRTNVAIVDATDQELMLKAFSATAEEIEEINAAKN